MVASYDRLQSCFLPSRFQGKAVRLQPMSSARTDEMFAFARGLPEQDLLFLDRDIFQPAEVDRWGRNVPERRLVTTVTQGSLWSLLKSNGIRSIIHLPYQP